MKRIWARALWVAAGSVAVCGLAGIFPAIPSAWAQEMQTPPKQQEEKRAEERRAPAAPKLGHPLDPADVDTLTGKNKSSTTSGSYAAPYVYASYRLGNELYGNSRGFGSSGAFTFGNGRFFGRRGFEGELFFFDGLAFTGRREFSFGGGFGTGIFKPAPARPRFSFRH
jgi:hypothetical protein